MALLNVNIDHVATIRQARQTDEPDPVWAAVQCELAGANGITVHLRQDRRHINDRDVQVLKETVACKFNLEMCMEDIAAHYSGLRAAGVRPLSVGGDHSVTYPILKALGADEPLGCVHIDAHCDTGGEYDHSKFHHGGPFRTAVLDGVLDPDRTIQIGIRGNSEFMWEFSYESGMTVVHIEDFQRMGVDAVVEKARSVVGGGPVYVTFDVDGLDPSFAPGTGTPEIGGLTPREALALLHGLSGLNVIGGDVVEIAPQYDATTNTAHVGAQLLFEILSLMTLNKF